MGARSTAAVEARSWAADLTRLASEALVTAAWVLLRARGPLGRALDNAARSLIATSFRLEARSEAIERTIR